MIRGAITGALWVLRGEDAAIADDVTLFQNPSALGDFLTGLFHLAREVVQRRTELIKRLDEVLMHYTDTEFLEAAPSMRQAFAYFSPREKHFIASSILKSAGLSNAAPLAPLSVDMQTAQRALLIESRTKETLKRFRIRGGE